MIFVITAVLALVQTWFFPWWSLCITCLILGMVFGEGPKVTRSVALGAATAWVLRALLWDSQSSGVVSKRLAGLLSLPEVWMIYFVIGLLAFITAGLWARSGVILRARV